MASNHQLATVNYCLHQVTHKTREVKGIDQGELNSASTVFWASLHDGLGEKLVPMAVEEFSLFQQLALDKVGNVSPRVLRCQLDGVLTEKVVEEIRDRNFLSATAGQLFTAFYRGEIIGLSGVRIHALGQPIVIDGRDHCLTLFFPAKYETVGKRRSVKNYPKPFLGLTRLDRVVEAGGWTKRDRFLVVEKSAK